MRLSSRLFLAAAALVLAPLARAVSVTLDFTAEIYFLAQGTPGLSEGQIITGSVTYDSTSPDQNPGLPNVGVYSGSITGGHMSVGSYSGNLFLPSTVFEIVNGMDVGGGNTVDGVYLEGYLTQNQPGVPFLNRWTMTLQTPAANVPSAAFGSDALPASGAGWPGLDLFTGYNTMSLTVFNPNTGVSSSAYATVTSLTASTASGVPDGGAVGALLALALGGFALARRRVYA